MLDKFRILRIGSTVSRVMNLRVTQTRYTEVGTASNVINVLRRKKLDRNPDGMMGRRVAKALEVAIPCLEVTCMESQTHVYDPLVANYVYGLYLAGRILCDDFEFLFSVDPNGTLTVRQSSHQQQQQQQQSSEGVP